jgi:hypothetical protein
MTPSPARLMLLATIPLVASFVVLSIGAVGTSVWLMHGTSIAAMCVLAFVAGRVRRGAGGPMILGVIAALAVVGIGATLLSGDLPPRRWVSLGAVRLYMAPVVLPSLLAACAVTVRRRGATDIIAFGAVIGASLLLAAQPDASQVLALFAGAAACCVHGRAHVRRSVVTLCIVAGITAWSFAQPDPLEPVAYVEGVFALALERSPVAGAFVIGSAIAFLVGLYRAARAEWFWLSAVASYYVALYACSIAGLTPAPLIGYGAGPLLGYGMLFALSRWIVSDDRVLHAGDTA